MRLNYFLLGIVFINILNDTSDYFVTKHSENYFNACFDMNFQADRHKILWFWRYPGIMLACQGVPTRKVPRNSKENELSR